MSGYPDYSKMPEPHPYGCDTYGQSYSPQCSPVPHCSPAPHCNPAPQYAPPPYVQNTSNNTTVVTAQPNVMVVQPSMPAPANYMTLSVLSCFLCVWPIGLVAIIFSHLSSEDFRAGNHEGARTKGKVALGLSIASMCSGVIIIVGLVAWYFSILNSW